MSYEKVDVKYLAGKRKQLIEWDKKTGNIRVTLMTNDNFLISYTVKKVKKYIKCVGRINNIKRKVLL